MAVLLELGWSLDAPRRHPPVAALLLAAAGCGGNSSTGTPTPAAPGQQGQPDKVAAGVIAIGVALAVVFRLVERSVLGWYHGQRTAGKEW